MTIYKIWDKYNKCYYKRSRRTVYEERSSAKRVGTKYLGHGNYSVHAFKLKPVEIPEDA